MCIDAKCHILRHLRKKMDKVKSSRGNKTRNKKLNSETWFRLSKSDQRMKGYDDTARNILEYRN